jgi:hypothetical protein
MFKVWHDEISDARFDVRDYEELVGKYAYLVDSCVQEIRLGHWEVSKPVKVLGAKGNTRDFKVGTKKCDQSEALNLFQNRSKYCVLHSFLLTMKMEEDVRDYMVTAIPEERTDLKNCLFAVINCLFSVINSCLFAVINCLFSVINTKTHLIVFSNQYKDSTVLNCWVLVINTP